jgi:HSP20 family protein
MDVYEKDNAIVVKAELPGMKKEDVQVEIEGEDLIIRGESKAESEVKDEDYYRSERSFGSFYRRMPLPAGVTAEQIHASLTDGVLEVRVPKPAEAKAEAKKIPVK